MPKTEIRLFCNKSGSCPFQEWFCSLELTNPRAYKKCHYLIKVLAEKGNELRRPNADSLRDGVHEHRGKVELAEAVNREAFNASIAQQIYDNRQAAGLTQDDLAKRVGTRQSVIARMEDSDYAGHSLSMLWKISHALGKQIYVEFRQRYSELEVADATPKTVSLSAEKIEYREMYEWEPKVNYQPGEQICAFLSQA